MKHELTLDFEIFGITQPVNIEIEGGRHDWYLTKLYMLDDNGDEINLYPIVNCQAMVDNLEEEINERLYKDWLESFDEVG